MAAKKKPCKAGKIRRKIKNGRKMCLPKKKKAAAKPKKAARRTTRRTHSGSGGLVTARSYFGIKDRPAGASGWAAAKPCEDFDWVTNGRGTSTLADLDTKTCKPLACDLKKAIAKARSLKDAGEYHTGATQRILRPCEDHGRDRLYPGATRATAKAVRDAIPEKVKKQQAEWAKYNYD